MTWLDIAIILGYIAFAIITGFRSKAESGKNLEEYFLAGRSLKGWQSGVSMAATQFAADTPLLVTGLLATAGIFSMWRLWIYALAFLLLGFLLAPSWRRAGVITDAELTELRYGQKPALMLRAFKAVYLGTLFNCTVLAMVLLAATRIAEPFLVWDQWIPGAFYDGVVSLVQSIGAPLTIVTDQMKPAQIWTNSANNLISILIIAAVTTFYSTTGGLRNVIKMDIFQFVIKMFSTVVYMYFVIEAVGGLPAMAAKIHQLGAQLGNIGGMTPTQLLAFTPGEAKDVTALLIAVFAVQWIAQINADGSGYLAQRVMACRTEKDAKQASVIFVVLQIICRSLLWLVIGVGLLLIFPPDPNAMQGDVYKAQREMTYVLGIKELMPPGFLGLLVTGLLAALGSTIDTHLNWGASYWTNDIYKRIICEGIIKKEPNPKTLVWVARGSNLMILFISLFLMTRLSSIQTAWQASLLLGAGLGVLLVLRWVWWRVNAWGEIATIVTSFILAPILLLSTFPGYDQDSVRLLILATVATAAGILVSLIMPPEKTGQLQEFYKRAHPPGFWGPIATSLGEDPKLGVQRLVRSMSAMVTAAISIFCVLTGLGSWMVGSPAPAFFPWPGPWIATLLVVGLALVPVWWKLVFEGDTPHEVETLA